MRCTRQRKKIFVVVVLAENNKRNKQTKTNVRKDKQKTNVRKENHYNFLESKTNYKRLNSSTKDAISALEIK